MSQQEKRTKVLGRLRIDVCTNGAVIVVHERRLHVTDWPERRQKVVKVGSERVVEDVLTTKTAFATIYETHGFSSMERAVTHLQQLAKDCEAEPRKITYAEYEIMAQGAGQDEYYRR